MNTKRIIGLAVTTLVASSNIALAGDGLRDTVNINFGWNFGRSKSAMTQTVNLPHDFQISQPWIAPNIDEKADHSDAAANVTSRLSSRGFKEMGEGWYRYALVPQAAWKGRRVLLDFEGIMLVGDVWLNGELVGKTDYGYLGFDADVTKKLIYGQTNEILVRASTQEPLNSRWYTGGGLYRNVNIVITNDSLFFPRHPLYITTKNNREVCIKSEITYRGKAKTLSVGVRILDDAGHEVASLKERLPFNAKWRTREYTLPAVAVTNARLWSPDTPYLYTAEVTLYDAAGRAVDKVAEQFGIRTLEFSPEFGLKINGRKTLLKGWANHHSLGALGAAAYPRAIEKRLLLMKRFGFNHVRTAHNPYSEDFLKLCDKHGILVVDELYDKWLKQYAGGRVEWTSLWQHDVPEFIRRDRNHPSIVMWSLGNELQQYSNLPFNDWGVTPYKLQRLLLEKYDTTRPVTVAMHPRYRNLETDSIPADLALATDVAAYNYRYMYFPGDSKRFPRMIFYQSEANTTNLGSNYFSMDLNKVLGLAYWGAIDYLGESHGWPAKGDVRGEFDLSLQPKPNAYFMKSMFSDEPVVHIGVIEERAKESFWNGISDGTPLLSENWNRDNGSLVSLYTYTNAAEVELFVNGKSMGVKQNSSDPKARNKIRWDDIPYQSGTVEAVARTNGKTVARHQLETAGEAVALRLIPDDERWQADGIDLQHVRVVAVDKKGRRVWGATDRLAFSVEGNAEVVAVDNGDMTSNELHVGNTRSLFNGTALVILRSGKQAPGKVTLTVNTPRFKPAKLTLKQH